MLISWMSTNGMFNQILMGLGIIKEGKNILLDADKYWWIASLSDVWKEADGNDSVSGHYGRH